MKKFFRVVTGFADFFVETEIRKLDIISHSYKIRKKKTTDSQSTVFLFTHSYLKISTYTV
nr:MAG TPA: hypothetical protein [Caudoviricetes sp.]